MHRFRYLTLMFVLSVTALGIAPLAHAQQQQQTNPPTAAELEEFRRDFAQALQELDQQRQTLRQNPVVREALEKSSPYSHQAVADVQQQLQQMQYEELAQLYRGVNVAFPDWRQAPQALARIANRVGGQQTEGKTKQGVGTNAVGKDGVGTNAVTPDNCQDAFNAAPSWTDWGVTKAFEIAAQAAYELIPIPFNGIAMAAWIPLAEGANAAEILNLMYDRCSGDRDTQEIQTAIADIQNSQTQIINNSNAGTTTITNAIEDARTQITSNANSNTTTITNNAATNTSTLNTAITSAQTSINNTSNANTSTITGAVTNAQNTIVSNDNANRTTIINNANANTAALNTAVTNAANSIVANDNANRTTIINNANANTATLNAAIASAKADILANANANKTELRDLMLRSQIEADLASESSGVRVAWYMTPTANGGHLDLVQSIVTQTLANIQAAGGSIGNAQSFLTRANADKAAGNFKSAYDNYRQAYKAAAN